MLPLLLSSVLLSETYTKLGFAEFDPNQSFSSIGIFGPFGNGDKLVERNDAGLLTFMLKKDLPNQTLTWVNYKDDKDLDLGQVCFPGKVRNKRFEVVDWTTAKQSAITEENGNPLHTEAFFSRAFPAVLYTSQASSFEWKPLGLSCDRLAYQDAKGSLKTARKGEDIGPMGAPWVLLWNLPSPGIETTPILIRLERMPKAIRFGNPVSFEFGKAIDSFAVMPLFGVKRSSESWFGAVQKETNFWTRALAAFPVGTQESFGFVEKERKVVVFDRFTYKFMRDDWGTKPLMIAPISPVTAVAEANGYPIRFKAKVHRSRLATFLGPFSYAKGVAISYEIPIPSGRDNMLAPITVVGKENRVAEIGEMVKDNPPKLEDYADGGFNLTVKEYSQSYLLLDSESRKEITKPLKEALNRAYAPDILQTVTEPETGQRYLMSSKIWCANEPYDREWYAGRQLDAIAEYAAWVDPSVIWKHWREIQGLYAYFRIYSDWAWSGTSSSVFGYALCADGMNFAMEGMLGVARMAHQHGDKAMDLDASARAAKQAVCTYASFFLPQYVKDVDYATWTDTSYDYETKKGRYQTKRMNPEQVETRFGLDIYADTTGIRLLRPGSFWHTASGFFWNNPALYRLYTEHLYDRARKWEYQIMPQQHPGWNDRGAVERFENKPYGSNLTLTHLDARAVLFEDSESSLRSLMGKLQTEQPFHARLRIAQDLYAAGAPQVWVPIRQTRFRDAVWDPRSKKLTVMVDALESAPLNFDVLWRDGPTGKSVRPRSVTIKGKPSKTRQAPGGYWRVTQATTRGEATKVEFQF